MPDEQMVEAVARAICVSRCAEDAVRWYARHEDPPCEVCTHWHLYCPQASAALAEHTRQLAERGLVIVPGWQPIETAPRDGTDVLFFDPNTEEGGSVMLGRYEDGEWFDHSRDSFNRTPTHWMPLPPPPEGARDAYTSQSEADHAEAE